MEPCYNKAVKSNNKENSASKKQVRRQNHKRAHTVGIPVNQNKSAYVLERFVVVVNGKSFSYIFFQRGVICCSLFQEDPHAQGLPQAEVVHERADQPAHHHQEGELRQWEVE